MAQAALAASVVLLVCAMVNCPGVTDDELATATTNVRAAALVLVTLIVAPVTVLVVDVGQLIGVQLSITRARTDCAPVLVSVTVPRELAGTLTV